PPLSPSSPDTVLEPVSIARLQLANRRFLALTRDNAFWKTLCFEHSRARSSRRRAAAPAPNLAPLVQLVDNLHNSGTSAGGGGGASRAVHDAHAPSAETQAHRNAAAERKRALANWDPSYPGERFNFYQDYIHRHADVQVAWFEAARDAGSGEGGEEEDDGGEDKLRRRRQQQRHRPRHRRTGDDGGVSREAYGMGVLFDKGGDVASRVYAPLADGSVCAWDAAPRSARQGRLVARSRPGLFGRGGGRALAPEPGPVDAVSVDGRAQRAYFAVRDTVSEVDLATLQLVSQQPFPFAVQALSEMRHPTPMTVGTSHTLHLYDPRSRTVAAAAPVGGNESLGGGDRTARCELIGGGGGGGGGAVPRGRRGNDFGRLFTGDMPGTSHVTLSQPGPASILHLGERAWDGSGDIWVGGRFTSLLNFDRRAFARPRRSVFSGARVSCLAALPHAFVPRELGPARDGAALGAAQVRAAKAAPGTTLLAAGEYRAKGALEAYGFEPAPAHDTPSAAAAAVAHPGPTAYRNRQTAARSKLLAVAPHGARIAYADADGRVVWVERDACTPVRQHNINEGGGDEGGGAGDEGDGGGDMVQKLVPALESGARAAADSKWRLHEDNLLLWTADGRVGMLGFGKRAPFGGGAGGGGVVEGWEESAEEERERRRREEERVYGRTMRRVLERQADEVRFMSGLGMGGGW
ncbi:hypothetical protein BDY21DRAFT_284238, partial [Lineolata rhizophorae]